MRPESTIPTLGECTVLKNNQLEVRAKLRLSAVPEKPLLTASKQNASNLQLHETSPQPQGSPAALRSVFPGRLPRETKATAGLCRNAELGEEAFAELLFWAEGQEERERKRVQETDWKCRSGAGIHSNPRSRGALRVCLVVGRLEKVWCCC